ncbi:MAG: NUDIX domain-containing protein [Nanoarchaeota archaeon]
MGYSGAILRNKEGKILFQLRDKNGRNPNKWGIFGGGIKKNETPEQAVIRELKEELGIVTSRSDFIKEHNIPLVNYHIFQIKLRKIPKKSDLREGKRMKLMTKEEFFKTKNALLRVKIFLKIFE